MTSPEAGNEQAAGILRAINHALITANQECGDIAASDHWHVLIEAATNHAHQLLTGLTIDQLQSQIAEARP